jgi:hypothetical protein
MTIFYRGRCARITHEVFEVWCPAYRVYELRGLHQVQVVEQPTDPAPLLRGARIGSTSVAGAAAVAGAIGWAEGWQALESPVGVVAIVILFVAVGTACATCWRASPAEQELVAVYRGRPVTLYRSPNGTEFGQVRRGLLRALQHVDNTR